MLRRNAALKITSLLLALFLWFYVRLTEQNPFVTEPLRPAVEVRNLPAGLALASRLPEVEVMARGPAGAMEDAERTAVTWVNLRGAKLGTRTVPVQVRLPAQLTRVRVRPQRVSVRLVRAVSKRLPVECYLPGSAPPGWSIGDPQVEPSEVEVSGPGRSVERVAQALVSVDVAYARTRIRRDAEVKALDANGDPVPYVTVEPAEVRVTVPVTRVEVYRTVPVVLRTAGSVAAGHRIARVVLQPPVVSIAGDDAAIRGVTYVETEPLDLARADAPISRAVRLVTPRGVTTLGARQVSVEIEIAEE